MNKFRIRTSLTNQTFSNIMIYLGCFFGFEINRYQCLLMNTNLTNMNKTGSFSSGPKQLYTYMWLILGPRALTSTQKNFYYRYIRRISNIICRQ